MTKFEFTKREIDVMHVALTMAIDYLEDLFAGKDTGERLKLRQQIREVEDLATKLKGANDGSK